MNLHTLKATINSELPKPAALELLAYWFLETKGVFNDYSPGSRIRFMKGEVQRINELKPALSYTPKEMQEAARRVFFNPEPLELDGNYLCTFMSKESVRELMEIHGTLGVLEEWAWRPRKGLLVPLTGFLKEIGYPQDSIDSLDGLIKTLNVIDTIQVPEIRKQLIRKIKNKSVFSKTDFSQAYWIMSVLITSQYGKFIECSKQLKCKCEDMLP